MDFAVPISNQHKAQEKASIGPKSSARLIRIQIPRYITGGVSVAGSLDRRQLWSLGRSKERSTLFK